MCPSEVSDVEHTIWQAYQDRGVKVWGVAGDDPLATLIAFRDQMGVTFPILFDENGEVHDQYNAGPNETNSVYPQDWIIGGDGRVVYVNRAYEPEEMIGVIEAELERLGE